MIPTVCALSSLSLEMNSLGSDWRGCACVCVRVQGVGSGCGKGVASLEMVNRIIERGSSAA